MNLYHYCSQEAFLSILRTRTFRCSALSLSNDTMEGKWIHKIFSDICDEDGLKEQDKNLAIKILSIVNEFYEGFGFCLSALGDSLSQWRGYAQDGEGLCIGFSKDGLEALREKIGKSNFDLIQVNYDFNQQQKELKPTYEKIKKFITELHSEDTEEERKNITKQLVSMTKKFFEQKNPAFEEEKEWRVVSGFYKGGTYNDTELSSIEFRSAGDRIVPYRPFEFDPKSGIITEILLGPKNQTPMDIVEFALKKFGYENVTVKKSKASYR